MHTGGNLYIYKNGVLEDSVVSGNTGGVNGKVYLGSSYNGATNRYAEGYIDDVRTYNRALSAEEITQLYKMGEGSKVGKTPTTPAGLETGLTAHWTFDGPDMINAITDVSGNGHDVFLTSGMATNTSPGKVGQALSFDASGYIDTASDFSNFITTDEGTISLWLKPSQAAPDVTSQSSMWGGRQAIGGYATFGLFGIAQANNTGLGEDKIWAWNWGTSLKAVGVTYNVGEWIHITWVHSGGTLYVYKNGELVDSVASDSTGAAGNFLIGNNWFSLGGTSRRWKGDMDDIYTYNRALSADEIKQIYNLGGNKVGKTVTPTGQDSGLVGHWTFDGPDMDWGSASAEVQDASGNGNDGDATSMTTNSVVPLGAIGQALQFDGSGDYIDIGTSADFKPTGSLAVSFWYKGLKGSAEHFISHSPQSLTNYWYVSEDQSMFCGSTSCSTSVVNTFTLPDDNEWHHVVVSLNETPSPDELSVYIDGVLDDTVTDNRDGGSNWGSNTRIGTGFWGGSGDRQGPMDDVRIYNRALTADEALQLYNMGR